MAVHGFRRSGGRVVLRVDDIERGLLAHVLDQLVELVAPETPADADPLAALVSIDPDATRPDDPALARLLPDAYADDDEASAEFRRYTERSLREQKVAHATLVIAALSADERKIVVADQDVPAWLGALNDARLALGTRLGITEETHHIFASLDEDDPAFMAYNVYDWLTFLQETLVQAAFGLRSEPPAGADLD